jgi:Rod binding domain-containing protein
MSGSIASIATPQGALDAAGGGLNAISAAMAKLKHSPEAMKVAKEFESSFLSQMLQPMFETLSTEPPFGGGAAEQTFRPMLVSQYAESLSKAGGIGIADAVLREIVKIQMAQNGGQVPGAAEEPGAAGENDGAARQ